MMGWLGQAVLLKRRSPQAQHLHNFQTPFWNYLDPSHGPEAEISQIYQ